MQVISTGDQLWNAVSRKPLEELQLRDETRDLFRHGLFLEPLPMVSRVIFICTPHRGSYVAGRRALANITRQLLTLPLSSRGGGRPQPKPGRLESRVPPIGGRQLVARAPLHPGSAGDPRRAVREGQLHHRRRGGRAGRAGRRWRGQVRRRAHRAGRVRAGREVEPFHARQSPHDRGGPPHSPCPRGAGTGYGPSGAR